MSTAKVASSPVHGSVASGFERVEREFRRNFAERGEVGAACAMHFRGQKVVDLWGGYRDRKTRAPWEEDTLVVVFSATKGMAAMALAVAHSCGLLDYDEAVSTYWPEFAQHGKAAITVRQLLSHQAGLCAIDEPLDLNTIGDHEALAAVLARQKPAWLPGTRHGYHCWTMGWYMSELMRRVDPHGRGIGQYFHDEIATPLGVEFYISLPGDIPDARLATLIPAGTSKALAALRQHPYLRCLLRAALNPSKSKPLTYRTLMNPKALTNHRNLNKRELLSLEIASENGIGQVRSMARAYSVFAAGGGELSLDNETIAALTAPVVPPGGGWRDEVLLVDNCYSLGFNRPLHNFTFGVSDRAFGHAGASGAFAFADPDAQVGYAYAPNRVGIYGSDDPRERALRNALYECLKTQ